MNSRRAQISLQEAPKTVAIVSLVFLTMATLAFIALKYGAAIPADESATIINETLTTVTYSGEYVNGINSCNFENFVITSVINATGGQAIAAPNYTYTQDGLVRSITSGHYNNTNWKVSYTYDYTGTACNVTTDLQTEIENNTSITGIVLTISLVGIVLSVLVGVFVLANRKGL